MDPTYCHHCGIRLVTQARFCSVCGTAVAPIPAEPSTPPPVENLFADEDHIEASALHDDDNPAYIWTFAATAVGESTLSTKDGALREPPLDFSREWDPEGQLPIKVQLLLTGDPNGFTEIGPPEQWAGGVIVRRTQDGRIVWVEVIARDLDDLDRIQRETGFDRANIASLAIYPFGQNWIGWRRADEVDPDYPFTGLRT